VSALARTLAVPALSLDEALGAPELFAPLFPEWTWATWRTVLRAMEGRPPRPGDLQRFRRLAGPRPWPNEPVRELWLIIGRRGGKTRAMALVGVHRACFVDYTPYLAPGEQATVMLLACDRTQARVAMRCFGNLVTRVVLEALDEG
jgi:hypothetical protein